MPMYLLGGFIGLMSVGVPLALVIIGSGLLYILVATNVPLSIVGQRLFVTLDDFTLMAIPLFVLAGYLMNEVGLTERLVEFVRFLLRRVYGALAQVSVLVSMAFGGVSGAAAADLAAVGIPMIPQMEKNGYRREFATATITTSSLMGAVLPPSIPFIIYGVQAETSIGKLFLAGIIPGIGIGIVVMVVNYILLKRQRFVEPPLSPDELLSGKRLALASKDALIALLMPVIIIGGILLGVVTPTEAAALAVLYALVVGFFVFRTLNLKKIITVLRSSVMMSAVIMLIVAGSGVLNWALAYSLVPRMIAEALLSVTSSAIVFMLIVIVLLLIVGMPLDPVPAIIVVTPILLPAAIGFGIDPVHFGVVVVMVLTIGLATPPVGASLFVAMSISRVSMSRLSRAIIPFLAALLAFTLLIAFVPETYTWLTALMK